MHVVPRCILCTVRVACRLGRTRPTEAPTTVLPAASPRGATEGSSVRSCDDDRPMDKQQTADGWLAGLSWVHCHIKAETLL